MGGEENKKPLNPRKFSFWEFLFPFLFVLDLISSKPEEDHEKVIRVGHRFHPTDVELINHFLKNKILRKLYLVDEIGEININNHDPESLRDLSKIQSNDPTWYFFVETVFMNRKKKPARKRITPSGTWGPSGKDREIKDKNGNKIGLKKTLVYHERGAPKSVKKKSPWIMHEYHITSWSHPDSEKYVLCKIKYKGKEDGDIGEPSQSLLVSESNTVTTIISSPPQQQALYFAEEESLNNFGINEWFSDSKNNHNVQPQIPDLAQDDYDFIVGCDPNNNNPNLQVQENDENTNQESTVQQDYNKYKPKPSQSGYINSDNDSDAESISETSYQGTSSSRGSSNNHFPSCSSTNSCKDLQTSSSDSSINRENTESQQEVKTTHKNNPKFVYLMKRIIGLILLLALIGNIKLVLSTVET